MKNHTKIFGFTLFSYKTLIGAKPWRIRFDRIEDLVYGTRYLVLFDPKKYDVIFNMIRYLKGVKCDIKYVFCHNYASIKVDSYDSLPLKESLTLHNVITHIKSVLNKDQNHYYYNTFLEQCSYQLAKK